MSSCLAKPNRPNRPNKLNKPDQRNPLDSSSLDSGLLPLNLPVRSARNFSQLAFDGQSCTRATNCESLQGRNLEFVPPEVGHCSRSLVGVVAASKQATAERAKWRARPPMCKQDDKLELPNLH